jgi:alkylation response protein AidB-like acyl-CoA dehydrogenase
MDFAYSAAQRHFCDELRAWLESKRRAGGVPSKKEGSLDRYVAEGRRWQRELYEGGWCGLAWPVAYGGKGIGLIEQIIFQEELARAGSPQLVNLLALTMVGPLLIDHGSEKQKARYLKNILTADELWCQGYSEPGAGSDLAAVSTKAERDGDAYIVNGQKVWTSYAQYAELCILLARTDAGAAKHKGLTLMIVDMKSDGVDVRPLRQMNGDSEFNEVYFTDVRVDATDVIGEPGKGWDMAVAMLMYERATLTFQRQLQSRVALDDLMRFVREFDARGAVAGADSLVRQKVAQAYIESEALRLTALRHLTKQLNGRPPGPEGSIEKLFWSEMFQRMLEIPLGVMGPYGLLDERDPRAPLDGRWPHLYLYSRGRTIAAGTSEIQRGIIAQRVLGLPKDR